MNAVAGCPRCTLSIGQLIHEENYGKISSSFFVHQTFEVGSNICYLLAVFGARCIKASVCSGHFGVIFSATVTYGEKLGGGKIRGISGLWRATPSEHKKRQQDASNKQKCRNDICGHALLRR